MALGRERPRHGRAGGAGPHTLQLLQQSAGNVAVARLLSGRTDGDAPVAAMVVQRNGGGTSKAAAAPPVLRSDVANAIAMFAHARALATRDPPDLATAQVLVSGIREWLGEVANPARVAEAYGDRGLAHQSAQMLVGFSVEAARSMEARIQIAADYGSKPMSQGTWGYYSTMLSAGREYLEVLTGERPYAASEGAGIEEVGKDILEFYVSLVPIVGTLVAAGEAILGRDLSGRPLGVGQRAILGGAAVVGALGPLLRAGRAVPAAARLALVSAHSAFGQISILEAGRLLMGTRAITPRQAARLRRLAWAVKAGRPLSVAQIREANFIISRMREGALVGETLRAAKQTGSTARIVDLSGHMTAEEQRAAAALSDHFGERVIKIAEQESVVGVNLPGARTGDFVVGRQLVEFRTVRSPRMANALSAIAKKHQQAGVVAVDLTSSSLTAEALRESAPRLWGRPEFLDVSRLLIMRGGAVVHDLRRPASMLVTAEAAATTMSAPAGRVGAGRQ